MKKHRQHGMAMKGAQTLRPKIIWNCFMICDVARTAHGVHWYVPTTWWNIFIERYTHTGNRTGMTSGMQAKRRKYKVAIRQSIRWLEVWIEWGEIEQNGIQCNSNVFDSIWCDFHEMMLPWLTIAQCIADSCFKQTKKWNLKKLKERKDFRILLAVCAYFLLSFMQLRQACLPNGLVVDSVDTQIIHTTKRKFHSIW